jgi:Tol biopolymer transport system component
MAVCSLLGAGSINAVEPARVTHDGRLKRDLRFVEGGRAVVYAVVESPTITSLMRVEMRAGTPTRLHPMAATSQIEPAFSPDGRFRAWVEFRGVTNVKLLLRDLLENREALFDPGSDRAHLGSPAIAPDGSRVAFSLPQSSGQQIVSVDMQGRDKRNLTDTAGINDWPVYSPDGSQIAFGSSRDGDFEIYIMGADGSGARRLTENPGIDMRPAWSPDGTRIAFTSGRDGNYELYTVSARGGGLTRLTSHPERDDYPQWHPAGGQLAWIAERDGEFDVYLQDAAP